MKKSGDIKITYTFSPSLDYEERLQKVYETLMKAGENTGNEKEGQKNLKYWSC